jgi:hypothetical protein
MKNLYFLLMVLFSTVAFGNNILVQNVTTTGNNATNKTIQVQFDLSWENSWRDAINWDAAWVFMKFKNASGVWQHVQLNTTGFANGTGTTNTVQVTSDKVGAWVYRSAAGTGTFNSTSMQLQWNYGLSGLTSVTGLEVRVYAVEMVYVPQGEFNCAGVPREPGFTNPQPLRSFYYSNSGGTRSDGLFYSPGNKFPVINNRLSPTLTYNDGTASSLRIKGDVGIDFNNDGTVENTTYPIGYTAFYCYKYELTEQQYADFLNTLTSAQRTTLGVAGTGITLSNGQYFSSTPNIACGNSTAQRLLSYADWSGVRPMSFLEFNKASYGPLQPVYIINNVSSAPIAGYPAWGNANRPSGFSFTATNVGYAANSTSTRYSSGASYYSILELTGSATEPVVKLNYLNFTNDNGNGSLSADGSSDISSWNQSNMILYIDQAQGYFLNGNSPTGYPLNNRGFRYVRSAE